MDYLSSRAIIWLPILVICLMVDLDQPGSFLIVVLSCLMAAQDQSKWLPFVVLSLMKYYRGWLLIALGGLTSVLVIEAVNALAKQIIGFGGETLKRKVLQAGALLTSASHLPDNSFPEIEELQQLVYQAENLLDEMDYYRLQDQIQQRGRTQEKGNYINKSSAATSSSGFWLASCSILSTLKGMYGVVSLLKTSFSRINLSRRMYMLAKHLQLSEKEVRYALQNKSPVITDPNTNISHTEATKLHETVSLLSCTEVFGREQEHDQLMNLLTNEKSAVVGPEYIAPKLKSFKVPVIAIVGSVGVGKTTLAQLVFNDPKIRSNFEVRLWIYVSTQIDSVRVTRAMLEQVILELDCYYGLRNINGFMNLKEHSNLNELKKMLEDILKSKRFLLVLDDVWEDQDKSQWDSMVAPLNYCSVKGSIILVTTRKQSVAKLVGARDTIYLQGLDDNAFSSFFSTCIFNDSNYGGNSRLRNIGQQIAKKFKGNPLAARILSARLKRYPDERDLIEIRDREGWKSENCLNDILYALRLNYEHMPFHLQRCFSYCVIFPEDHLFTCKELVYLWMAQGFIDVRSEGKRMEDIGSAYFNDLFNLGFFQIKQSTDGLVDYTFHDFIHDLAHSVAFKECLTINGTKPRQILPTIRHLSIFGSNERNEDAIVTSLACLKGENLENLRTIIIWDDELPSSICHSISDLLKKTKFLRAMRLELGSMVEQHNFIQNFVSLRYLRLNLRILPASIKTSSYTLPREICRLYHLEVFEIEGGGFLDELPNNFSDLVSLRHFNVEGKLHSKICGVGSLTSLQELNYFNVQENIGFEIKQLGSLKEIGGSLRISNLENVKSKEEASDARLAKKKNLDVLYLKWNPGEQGTESVLEGLRPNTNLKSLTIEGYGGVASPTWLGPSTFFLESLTLKGCKSLELLPPIGELEFLKDLTLSKLAVREIGPQCYGTPQSMIFPSLEKLEIIDMPYLEKWIWSDQLSPHLKKLTIEGCCKLVDIPFSGCSTSKVLKRFPSLETLTIANCPLISQLPQLPYSILSDISIVRT